LQNTNNKWFDKLTTTLSQVEGQITMTKIQNTKLVYDFEEGTFQFAKAVGCSLGHCRKQRQMLRTVNI
jgi:hypothetical protein